MVGKPERGNNFNRPTTNSSSDTWMPLLNLKYDQEQTIKIYVSVDWYAIDEYVSRMGKKANEGHSKVVHVKSLGQTDKLLIIVRLKYELRFRRY
jgi:hypothetical protein